jgi:DNA-binding transcriptional MerR regulator
MHSISEISRSFGIPVSALRYYDEIGLVPATERRGRVRYYDHDALKWLEYVRIWHDDAQLSLADTRSIVDSGRADERHELVAAMREELLGRIARMQRAAAVLEHMLGCTTDRPVDCSMTGAYLESRVEGALRGVETDAAAEFYPEWVREAGG